MTRKAKKSSAPVADVAPASKKVQILRTCGPKGESSHGLLQRLNPSSVIVVQGADLE